MPQVVFIDHQGADSRVDAPIGRSLMQVAVDHGISGILGDCGGSCSCATCHGYMDEPWMAKLPPRSETEVFMLGRRQLSWPAGDNYPGRSEAG